MVDNDFKELTFSSTRDSRNLTLKTSWFFPSGATEESCKGLLFNIVGLQLSAPAQIHNSLPYQTRMTSQTFQVTVPRIPINTHKPF